MNESHLRSWAPRRPSPEVKRRIFSGAHGAALALEEAPLQESPPFRLAWLAPATMALVVIGLLFNQRNNPFPSDSGSGAMVAVALSNQSAASWLPGSFVADHNSVPVETLELTNGGRTQPRSGAD